jgi:hypothetical protein
MLGIDRGAVRRANVTVGERNVTVGERNVTVGERSVTVGVQRSAIRGPAGDARRTPAHKNVPGGRPLGPPRDDRKEPWWKSRSV